MLDKKIPLPWGAINIAPVVSTAQTNVSANDLVAAFGKQDVKVELQTLSAFAAKVEALLAAMEGSAAAPYKLEEQKLTQTSFVSGGNPGSFTEAVALTTAYGKVHSQLVKFHKDFKAQIEAMQNAVTKTAGTYSTNEDNTTADQNAVAKNAGVSPTTTKEKTTL
ncbi:hypothetical protein BX285_0555 [Streptomyces sp. 1114.5]|uniref:hypothetical protein n=1 Tax=unclassified Streptomyces TaxID=2593676 RepID=UPI000BCD799A|nr:MULTISPECIES: hypothetical protein [unclassified Streptomyces]RKT16226.1 hypothetical protein BX285_0555 [Streptomyces sp. 1114.5]SOB82398.1 hypothetical protein SAMN06272789_2561 [Streptomyces sp. 1331.2]